MGGWAFPVGSFFLGKSSSQLQAVFSLFPCVRNMLELEYLLIILCKTRNSQKTSLGQVAPQVLPKIP